MYPLITLMRKASQCRWALGLLLLLGLMCGPARAQETTSANTDGAVLPSPPRVVLVLGSGGARGLAHVGVLQALEEARVPLDLIVGTSAGSIVGSIYADHADAAALRAIFANVTPQDFIDFSFRHIFNGPIKGDKLADFLETNLQARDFRDLKIPFVAVATDFGAGEVLPLTSGPLVEAVHASAALPPYLRPVQLDGRTLVDGGVTAPLPVNVALKYKPDIVIAVDVSGALPAKILTNDVSTVARAYSITLDVLCQLNGQNADVVINPDVDGATTFKFTDPTVLFDAGAKAANEALPKIKRLLAAKGIELP